MSYRILHCLRAPVGGLFRHVRDLSTMQNDAGHAVGVVCDTLTNDALSRPRLEAMSHHLDLGLTMMPMSRGPDPRDLSVSRAIADLARQHNIDIIHGHGAKGGAYARLAARAARRQNSRPRQNQHISCIYTPHGGSLHFAPSTLKGRVYMAMERYLARHTDAIAFESAYSKNVFSRQIGPPPCRTAVIPNGLLAQEFEPVEPNKNVDDFLFVGELRHLKGVDVMLNALKIVAQSRTVRATIIGAGPDAAQFKTLCTSLQLDDNVRFAGAVPAREAFAMGRALVMPSRAESFPYIVLEAAAAGLPLLASDVGGVSEIIAQTDTALLPPGDIDKLALAMHDVLDAPDKAAARAARLKAAVAQNFTAQGMARDVERLYDASAQALQNETELE